MNTNRKPLPEIHDRDLDLSPEIKTYSDPTEKHHDCTDRHGHVFVSGGGKVRCMYCGKPA